MQAGVFERIVGSPFPDYIVGGPGVEEIWGGGGADVIEGGGGADQIHGGADGDVLRAGPGATLFGEAGEDSCEGGGTAVACAAAPSGDVELRDPGLVSVGETSVAGQTQVYVTGGSTPDAIAVGYAGSGNVELALGSGSFDASAADAGGCLVSTAKPPTTASCPVSGRLDAVLLAGLGGDDAISANVPDGVDVFELGGGGADTLNGSPSEDVLVDGAGTSVDTLHAGAGDDALTHNGGADLLDGGEGSDLFLSVSICDGETIDGGDERVGAPTPDRDNASWARLATIGVDARLDQHRVGEIGAGGEPQCPGASFDALSRIEDLEASNQSDVLFGDEGANQLLGHKGSDTYFALGGNDSILANSGSADAVIDCGPGLDQAIVDKPPVIDPAPIECESTREGAPGEFEELPLLTEPPPSPPPPASPPLTNPPPVQPPPDRTAPRTKLLRRPAKLLRVAPHRRTLVSFRFAASEKSSFRCRLDGKPYAACRSPRQYRVGVGRHVFRLFAVDAAGNRDSTPALFEFKVIAVKRHHHPQQAQRQPARPTR